MPGSLSRGAWAASLGSLGRLPGGGSRAQTTRTTLTHRPFGFASKFMSILMSIFDRFGIDLGSVLRVMFGHLGALVGQSWSQSRLRTILISKKRCFQKTNATIGESTILRSKSAQDGAQDGPRSPQDESKIVLDRFFWLLNFHFVFALFLVPFWCRFGFRNGSPGVAPN